MACVYILRGSTGRFYIGSTENLTRRLAEHRRGNNHITRRFGTKLELVISKTVDDVIEARRIELALKRNRVWLAAGEISVAICGQVFEDRFSSVISPGRCCD